MSKHTAIYLRVSSDNGRQTTGNQRPELDAWLMVHGVGEDRQLWFEDHFTGRTMERPGWAACWESIASGAVGTLLVWKLDRIGRKASGLAQLFEKLPEMGVNLVSLRDNVDLSNPSGRLAATIIGSVAAYEVEVMSERIKAGIARANRERQQTGRPRVGGSRPGERRGKITEEMVSQVWRMRGTCSQKAIARALGISPRSVSAIFHERPAQVRSG